MWGLRIQNEREQNELPLLSTSYQLKKRFGEKANPVKRIFFANITGVEKNPWTTMTTDERLHFETSALDNSRRNGDQLALSTQSIKPNFLVNPASTIPAPQFLKELARFI